MFYRKKIKNLKNNINYLFDENRTLSDRISVLEFKIKAENKKYILMPYNSITRHCIKIKFLSADESRVITEVFSDKWSEIKQNDKYLEFWSISWSMPSYLDKVMYISDDKLVNMDVDVYKKAFYPEKKATDPIVKVGAESKKATDALDAMTYAVTTVKEKVTPNENQN